MDKYLSAVSNNFIDRSLRAILKVSTPEHSKNIILLVEMQKEHGSIIFTLAYKKMQTLVSENIDLNRTERSL